MLPLVALGIGLRFALWSLAGEAELQSDEAGYLHLAVQWRELGFYPDSFRFLWPPGYPAYLRACLSFGSGALDVARTGQILASASTGVCTGLIAWRLFGRGPALLATAGWALYLPLAAFTHLLWNETLFLALFLPALYQVLSVHAETDGRRATRRVIVAGLCLAGSLLIKEAATYLLPVWALLLALSCPTGLLQGVRRGTLLLLVVGACVTPWGLRNLEVYGRFIPLGSSLGENAYNGLNATYRNFDLIPLDVERMRRGQPPLSPRPFGTAPPEDAVPWDRAEEIAWLPGRLDENTRRGLAFAAEHPGWLVRSRLQKLSDAVVPTSFLTRHLALGHYAGPLGAGGWRAFAAWGSAIQVILLLSLGGAGLLTGLRRHPARWIVAGTAGYFAATTLLVSMSRFRLPLVPLLLAGAAVLVCRSGELRRSAGSAGWISAGLWWAALALAWWLNAPVLSQVWSMVLGANGPNPAEGL